MAICWFTIIIAIAEIAASSVNTNTPVIHWNTRLDISGVWSFRVTVSTRSGCSDVSTALFDTGMVWQENEPFDGSYTYTGPALQPSLTYYWCGWESQLRSASGNGSFSTSPVLPSALQELREVLGSANVSELYRGTTASIVGRVAPSGWMPTSVATPTYAGMFVRDSSAGVFAMLELGEIETARRVLDFMLSCMVAAGLRRVPHVIMGPPEHVTFDMVDQPDGAFHLVIAWAHYIGLTGNVTMRDTYFDFMSAVMDGFVAPGATCPNTTVPYFNSTLNLLFNPNLEHSRAGHYWAAYDVLTNYFAIEALRRMADLAAERAHANGWSEVRALLLKGVSESLMADCDGSSGMMYAELRGHWHDWNVPPAVAPAPLLWGVSWVNLGPVPAVGPALMGPAPPSAARLGIDPTVIDETIQCYNRRASFYWEAPAFSAQVPQTHINASTLTDPARVVIGKGWAWLTAWLVYREDYVSLAAQLRWLGAAATNNTLFGESYYYDCIRLHQTGCWGDIGNAEQASWFVWAMTVIRRRVDMK